MAIKKKNPALPKQDDKMMSGEYGGGMPRGMMKGKAKPIAKGRRKKKC